MKLVDRSDAQQEHITRKSFEICTNIVIIDVLNRRAVKKRRTVLKAFWFRNDGLGFLIKGFEHAQTEYNSTQFKGLRNLLQVVIISKEDVKRVNKLQIITFIYVVSYL